MRSSRGSGVDLQACHASLHVCVWSVRFEIPVQGWFLVACQHEIPDFTTGGRCRWALNKTTHRLWCWPLTSFSVTQLLSPSGFFLIYLFHVNLSFIKMISHESHIQLPFSIMKSHRVHVSFSASLPSQSSLFTCLGFSFSHIMGRHWEERLFKIYTRFGNILDSSRHAECSLWCSLFRVKICTLASGLFFCAVCSFLVSVK